ncbi:hypothetical protein [Christiangramia crocea]|uniref:Right-handed parallel beta-helix repeat-containing protein n=1 Tax=Christiangramia crocea TaxID=2904124 RepID=A0A9X1UYI5_9FLAO|nr:hypothetical protein [Gramella crocea]MCG9972546.1 hypothetical protein [Gramella crocea]
MKNTISAILILYFFFSTSIFAKIYYVDSETGKDSNSGNSPGNAWSSLENLNKISFKPGDKILFKAGTSYFGQLRVKGSGSENNPIIIDSYGEGDKPAIHGEGKKDYTLFLYNVEYWEIRNLEITNEGKESKAGRRGVTIEAENFGDCHHIVLDNLEIHRVNGSLNKKQGGGSAIIWKNSGDRVKTRFVNLIIQNSYIHDSARNAINSRGYTDRENWHPSIGVIIRDNLIERVPGDGIVPVGCEGALIEGNILRDFLDVLPHSEAAAGIWPWSSDNTLIQFNEVSGHKAKWDGQAYDSDWNCLGTIIQYNYSHDNYGGFLLICNNGDSYGTSKNIGNAGTVVRHNISVNDGIRPYPTERRGVFSPIFHITGPVKNTKIYNNIIIVPQKRFGNLGRTIVKMDNWGGPWPKNTLVKNNIFYVGNEAFEFKFGKDKKTRFENNVYYGKIEGLPKDPKAVFKKPEILNAHSRGDGFEILKNFLLKKSSPLRDRNIGVSEEILEGM